MAHLLQPGTHLSKRTNASSSASKRRKPAWSSSDGESSAWSGDDAIQRAGVVEFRADMFDFGAYISRGFDVICTNSVYKYGF